MLSSRHPAARNPCRRHALDRQAFLGIGIGKQPADIVIRVALGRHAADGADHGAQFAGQDGFAEIGARRLGDALFHQRAGEIIGPGLQAGKRERESELHPGHLKVRDVIVEQKPRQRVHDQMFLERGAGARMAFAVQPRLGMT